ncbi:MAG: hypothetical protein KDF60_20085 [Calditrichaeota bacterium]|nr:hypothetical protein [Calditrichota bacterium]MCB0837263.1 hypothetical protein [Bacteroidota bacterium]
MEFQQPMIEVWGIWIHEPMMTMTDLLVSTVCFFAWFQLKNLPKNHLIKRLLLIYFLSMGTATAVGGLVGHAFIEYLNLYYKLPGWFTSMLSIMVLERACIELARQYINPALGKFFARLNIIELLIFMYLSFSTLNFFFVELHSAYGLAVVFGFSLFVYKKTNHIGCKLFLYAVGFSFIAGAFYMFKIGIGPWFTHTDIAHVFMALSAWYFYLGGRAIVSELEEGR